MNRTPTGRYAASDVELTRPLALVLLLAVASGGCNSKAIDPPQVDAPRIGAAERHENATFSEADYRMLFIGNSHVWSAPKALRDLLIHDNPDIKIHLRTCSTSPFLDGHSKDPDTLEALDREGWDVVVLQAQKYSTSGKYDYPTTGAVRLTEIAQRNGARVIMFPEWRRVGHPTEAVRVQKLHESIAAKTGAEVAPVGLAWDRVLDSPEPFRLHMDDNNHANASGDCLTACVFFTLLRGKSPVGLPATQGSQMSQSQLTQIQTAAWESTRSLIAQPE